MSDDESRSNAQFWLRLGIFCLIGLCIAMAAVATMNWLNSLYGIGDVPKVVRGLVVVFFLALGSTALILLLGKKRGPKAKEAHSSLDR